MATIAELMVNITTNNKQLTAGLASASRSTNSFALKAQNGINSINQKVKGLSKSVFGLRQAFILAAAVPLFSKTFNLGRQFDAAIADLSAITGATGKDLKFLSDASLEFGRTTTLSASKAATAFKLVASAKPDLLNNVTALKAVTKQVILLAEASGTELPNAAKILGSSLNQFGASASQAGKFINVLAAGAKYGASEVADTGLALEDSGVIAHQAGLSFETLNAAIQVLASNSIKGSRAGVGLKNILIRLESQTNDNLKPSVVGLVSALENAGQTFDSVAKRAKFFGLESLTSANILIENSNQLNNLKSKLTGTQVALEQAKIKTNSFDGRMKSLSSAAESFALILFGKMKPGLTVVVTSLTNFINKITSSSENMNTLANIIMVGGPLLLGIAALAAGGLAVSFAFTGLSAAITGVSAAIAILVANPITVLLAAIAAGVVLLLQKFDLLKPAIANIGAFMQTIFSSVLDIVNQISNTITQIIAKAGSLANTVSSAVSSVTTSALDLLPGLKYNPNTVANPNNPAVAAARKARETSAQPQKLQITVTPDKDAFVNTMVGDTRLRDKMNAEIQAYAKNAARATRR